MNKLISVFGLCMFAAQVSAALITVPGDLENIDGNSNNSDPFNYTPSTMRYQQIYTASEFSMGGIIDDIRFRADGATGHSFSTSGIDVRIDLAYAATTVATASSTFADNIGSGLVTVLDTTNLTLSGTGGSTLNPFDIVIDVDNLFSYDPTQGDLLLDIYLRSGSPGTTQFDAEHRPTNPVVTRIIANSGSTGTPWTGYGLVTQFSIQPIPIPSAVWLFGSGLIGLIGFARRKA